MRTRMLWFSLLPACVIHTGDKTVEEETFEVLDSVSMVYFDVDSGYVRVSYAETDRITVRRIIQYQEEYPAVGMAVSSGELQLSASCPALAFACEVDHELIVPFGTQLSGGTGSGELVISAPDNKVDLETGSGEITVTDSSGALYLATGSGDISATGLLSLNVSAETGSGDVTLHHIGPPDNVTVDTGSGDVQLSVPAGTYAIDVDTGSGDIHMDGITLDANAPAKLTVDTGSGDVSILGI